MQFVFIVYPSAGQPKYVKVKAMTAFLKTKRGLELVSLPQILYDFIEKYITLYVLLIDQISISDYRYFLRYQAICVL